MRGRVDVAGRAVAVAARRGLASAGLAGSAGFGRSVSVVEAAAVPLVVRRGRAAVARAAVGVPLPCALKYVDPRRVDARRVRLEPVVHLLDEPLVGTELLRHGGRGTGSDEVAGGLSARRASPLSIRTGGGDCQGLLRSSRLVLNRQQMQGRGGPPCEAVPHDVRHTGRASAVRDSVSAGVAGAAARRRRRLRLRRRRRRQPGDGGVPGSHGIGRAGPVATGDHHRARARASDAPAEAQGPRPGVDGGGRPVVRRGLPRRLPARRTSPRRSRRSPQDAAADAQRDLDLLSNPASPTRSTRRPRPTAGSALDVLAPEGPARAGVTAASSSSSTPPATLEEQLRVHGALYLSEGQGRVAGLRLRRRRSGDDASPSSTATPAVARAVPPRSRSALVLAVCATLASVDSTVKPTDLALVKIKHAPPSVDVSPDVVWILAVGSDARPGEDMTRTRGDALQLIGMNTKTGAAAAIGVPRDSWVSIPGVGTDKINAALYYGGPQLLGETVGEPGRDPARLRVRHPLREVLQAMIDDIGGIDVDNPVAFSDTYLKPEGLRGREASTSAATTRWRSPGSATTCSAATSTARPTSSACCAASRPRSASGPASPASSRTACCRVMQNMATERLAGRALPAGPGRGPGEALARSPPASCRAGSATSAAPASCCRTSTRPGGSATRPATTPRSSPAIDADPSILALPCDPSAVCPGPKLTGQRGRMRS